MNRLTSSLSTAYPVIIYSYNKIGNMLSNSQVGTYTYPTNGARPHAVSTAGSNTYAYDDNGNMTSGAGRTITYDPENRPMSITSGGTTTTFFYDGNGERVRKTSGAITTTYIGELYECNGSTCYKYIFANGQRIARRVIGTPNVLYYHADHLGGSSVVTDVIGNKVENITYYPYGATRTDSGGPNVRHKYTGQELDAETGLYFYNARYYDPALGRFISADSIIPDPGDPQSFNRYSYVGNNPVNLTDPSGHSFLSGATGVDIDFNRETGHVMNTNLGINSVNGGFYAGPGAEISMNFSDDGIDIGGGVGVGAGVKVGVSAGDVDIFVGHGAAATVGYDPNNGPYASVWGGCTLCGGASASATYYPNSGNYQVGAGVGYGDAGVGVGYSNVGGTSVGAGYGGVGASYGLQTHRTRYSVDPTGSLIAGRKMTLANVESASNVTYREGGLIGLYLSLAGFDGVTLGSTVIGRNGISLTTDFSGFMSHELVHVGQWNTNGYVSFAGQYIGESIRNGYENNSFEKDARKQSGYPYYP